jgi:hypothetical protein
VIRTFSRSWRWPIRSQDLDLDLDLDKYPSTSPTPRSGWSTFTCGGANSGISPACHSPPYIPGLEVAGTVRALGDGVDTFRVGEPVVTLSASGEGGYASVAVADAELTASLDGSTVDLALAVSALPNAVTAHLALTRVAHLGKGESVLVHGAHRFADPAHLCSWAGLTPRHRESDTVVHRGHITKQGSKAVRWAAIEAVQRHPTTAKISADKQRIEARRGKNIAKVAAARKLLTLVYYGLRDEHIRALDRARAA